MEPTGGKPKSAPLSRPSEAAEPTSGPYEYRVEEERKRYTLERPTIIDKRVIARERANKIKIKHIVEL